MKRKRFTEEQIIKILQSHEAGVPLAELARENESAEGTIYTWKAKYGGMVVADAKRLKELEGENKKLKKLLAETMLEKTALSEALNRKW